MCVCKSQRGRGWALARDLTFVQAKIQKHQAFAAEVAAHSNAILALKTAGRAMLDRQHFASRDIKVGQINKNDFLL